MQSFRLYLIAIATVVVVVACDRMPLTSPTGSTITLQADRTTLPLNGQTTIRAVVTESSGTPVHNGTTVTFQPNIGTTVPVEATTVNGVATVTFFAGSVSGTGVVNAFSGGARTGSGNTSSTGVTMTIGSAAASAVSVSATPPSVSQSGGTVTISALVLDRDSNPLPGVSVLFSAPAGVLSSTQAITDTTGFARTTFTTTQTTRVTARAGTATGDVEVTVSAAPSITINAPDTGTAGVPVAISVSVAAGSNNSSPRQVQTLTLDFGDGTVETRTNVTGSAGFTHTYRNPGGYTLTARAVDVNGNTGTASDSIVITRTLPTPDLKISPNPADVNQIVAFAISATSPASGPPVESVRIFINGELAFSTTGSSGAFTRGFSSAGTYVITGEATDANGGVGRTTAFLIVEP